MIDRKSVIAEGIAFNATEGQRSTVSEKRMHAQLGHGKRALLLYPANRSIDRVVLIAKSTRDALD